MQSPTEQKLSSQDLAPSYVDLWEDVVQHGVRFSVQSTEGVDAIRGAWLRQAVKDGDETFAALRGVKSPYDLSVVQCVWACARVKAAVQAWAQLTSGDLTNAFGDRA